MDIGLLLLIIFSLFAIGLIIAIIFWGFRDHVKKTDYTDPIKLKENVKKEIEKEIKKKDEEEFKKLIRYQNYDIYDAMRDNKNECQYHFYKWYSPDTYREDFSKMAREYYKNYKIDGDKISWE